ncbi:unnamed protein product [Aphanomyces euteiches]|uniref:Uncharacterized protein n=1 Tax=Aphanomyces euteiches TaxID=100861 RepID=A0A6G0XIL9_9STRA|nr:hypothetical protein Ae201684_004417 [Aphanomyces euteiches]KAH9094382.1 hypothetical protein Ae201684P_016990 [Aphanomyces euteiches]KAH9105175.1 hypothetical protein AeMF1_018930 [Aphanomyces euteiches]KAH9120936.1 hypothetical protein LEN26_010897 [Aphanomyces euteiches]KAH9140801.1 hypothetical protein AeRB84_014980 [Aphanomyces euteiches]
MTAESTSEDLRVSEHFPRVPKACKDVGEPFFACLYKHGKQPEGVSDPDAGKKGMAACAKQLAAYNTCVDKVYAEKPRKIFRVPEAYRVRDE